MLKKLLSTMLVLSLVLVMFAGCGKKEETTSNEETTTSNESTTTETEEQTDSTTTETEETAPENFSVGLVTDLGGIDDKSFNQGTWEGILRFAEDNAGVETKSIQSESDADYLPNLSTFAEDELGLIVAAGYLFESSMGEVAQQFPDQQFLIIDSVVDQPNVTSAVFAEHEGSFLVGVAAALKAQEAGKDKVGFIGGVEGYLIGKFQAGFEAGVQAVDPEIEVMVQYAASFTDSQVGQSIANKMYDDGAYVIYHAAGNVGNGVITEAKNRRLNSEDVWVIGVDKDQYEEGIYEGENSVILTSMMKRVDNAAYDVAAKTMAGQVMGGQTVVYDFTNEGVSLPVENPNLSDDIVTKVAEFKEKVISGEIIVPDVPAEK